MTVESRAPRILIARPRLDCSFKPGPVPAVSGPPLNDVLRLFGLLVDQLAAMHRLQGHIVEVEERPLWLFELRELQQAARGVDRVYFPHRQASQFPIGDNAYYYKNAAFPEWLTLDPKGWGASLSWAPVAPDSADAEAWGHFAYLKRRIVDNRSLFGQPPLARVAEPGYLLFVCQLPHDETIKFHSQVGVAQALEAVLAFAEATGQRVLVKGHPAGTKGSGPLREMTAAQPLATWIDNASIHSCLADACSVYMVNSGVGFEAMLHDKPIVRFGEAEYGAVVPKAQPTVESLMALRDWRHSLEAYVGFIAAFRRRCLVLGDYTSARPIVEF